MLAAPMEGMDYGGGLGAGGSRNTSSASVSNPFMSNWGPLASKSDQLYIPGYSNPKQGVLDTSSQIVPPTLSAAPTAAKTPAAGVAAPDFNGHLFGKTGLFAYATWANQNGLQSSGWAKNGDLYNSFLRSIATPSQVAGYNGNSSLTGGRQ